MKTYSQFITEVAKKAVGTVPKDDVHISLRKAGMHQNRPDARLDHVERNYHANHTPEEVHKVLTKHGFHPVTHTKSGHPMSKPHTMYADDRAGGSTFTLHHRDGKVFYVHWNGRSARD